MDTCGRCHRGTRTTVRRGVTVYVHEDTGRMDCTTPRVPEADCPPACATLLNPIPGYSPRHASGCAHNTSATEHAWCPTCHGRVQVEEVDPHASTYRGRHEYEWTATRLACGHVLEGPERVVGASPGGEAAAEAMSSIQTQRRLARAAVMNEPGWGVGRG